MEQSVELQKENTRLRDHLMELQNKLEELEKENVKLQDQVKRLKKRLQENEFSETSDGTRCCFVLIRSCSPVPLNLHLLTAKSSGNPPACGASFRGCPVRVGPD